MTFQGKRTYCKGVELTMPIYEYECEQCGKIHEIIQKITDAPLVSCPACKGRLHKRISQCTFHLKGTGWYATDYARSSGADSASAKTKPDSSAKDSGGNSGTDTNSSTNTKKAD